MARLATTFDVFNAISEPQRREILCVLSKGERTVTDLVNHLQLRQPQVSKHLIVLKKVGLVSSRGDGRHHYYSVNSEGLKPIYDWVLPFERFWRESFDRMDDYLQQLQRTEDGNDGTP